MTTEQEIAQFIISTVGTNPNIRGSALGAKVKIQFPGVVIGKLTDFIKLHCANSVIIVDQNHLDYIWALKPNDDQLAVPSTAFTPNVQTKENSYTTGYVPESLSAWKVFTRYDKPGKLAVNPALAQIKVLALSDVATPPFVEVRSVSQTEYKNIAFEYISQIDEPDRQHFKSIIESESFNAEWYEKITTWKMGCYAKEWGKFRFERLCSIFIDRLAEIGVIGEEAKRCLNSLKSMKAKVLKDTPAPSIVTRNTRPSSEVSKLSIQDILANAIKNLNEDDLRRIWLPVGVVLDAIRRK